MTSSAFSGESCGSLALQQLRGERIEAREVAILGEQRRYAVLATHSDDLRVEREISDRASFYDRLEQKLGIPLAGRDEPQARRCEYTAQRLARLLDGEWRIEEARVGRHAQELAQAEDRQRPCCIALGELYQSRRSPCVLRQLLAVRVDQNVRVDGDQERPSIRS